MIGLQTARLIFRQWTRNDFFAVRDFFAQKESARFLGGVKTSEEAWRQMAAYIGHYALRGYSYIAVEEKSSGRLVGSVGLWKSEPWPEPELGYWLFPEAQGKGFGIEAALTVKDYGLNHSRFETLVSYIDPSNEPSKKLALRLGAILDGTIDLMESGRHDIYRYW